MSKQDRSRRGARGLRGLAASTALAACICAAAAAIPAAATPAAGAGVPVAAPPCTDGGAQCLEKIGRMYIGALLSHDGAALPLAPQVRRTENALTNARGAAEVRESFARTTMVKAARDVHFWTDEKAGEIVFFFCIDINLDKALAGATTKAGDREYKVAVTVPQGTYTVHEAERFKIVRGYISEIEIIAHVESGKGAGSGWPVEREAEVRKP